MIDEIKLGTKIDENGKPVSSGSEVTLNIDDLFKRRLLVQGISGSGKSTMIRKIISDIDEAIDTQKIIIDWEGEFRNLEKSMGFLVVEPKGGDSDTWKEALISGGEKWGTQIRQKAESLIIDLSGLKHRVDRELFVGSFIDAILNTEKKYYHKCVVMIDEAHNLCPQNGKSHSKDSIIRLCETGRKRNILTILATQRLSEINKNASAQMANSIIGLTVDLADRERALKFLGLSRNRVELGEIARLKVGEFYVAGTSTRRIYSNSSIVSDSCVKIKTEIPKVKEKQNIVVNEKDVLIKKLKDMIERIKGESVSNGELEGLLKAEYARGYEDATRVWREFDKHGFSKKSFLTRVREKIFE